LALKNALTCWIISSAFQGRRRASLQSCDNRPDQLQNHHDEQHAVDAPRDGYRKRLPGRGQDQVVDAATEHGDGDHEQGDGDRHECDVLAVHQELQQPLGCLAPHRGRPGQSFVID